MYQELKGPLLSGSVPFSSITPLQILTIAPFLRSGGLAGNRPVSANLLFDYGRLIRSLRSLSSPIRKFAHVFFKRPASGAGSAPIDHACVRPVH